MSNVINNNAQTPASPLSSDNRSDDFTPLSEEETRLYYAGLPSRPVLVARSSVTPWKLPSDPEADSELKELHPIGEHPIREVWGRDLAPEVLGYLDDQKVHWTSIDPVRISKGGERPFPVVLWIGVKPKSLSGKDGHAVVVKLHRRLQERGLGDVEVEIRESVLWGSGASLGAE